MKTISQTGWKKCGHFRVRTTVRAYEVSAIRQAWFRRMVTSSSREDNPESPSTDS